MDAIDAIRTRRSIRDYLPDEPPRALIEEIVRDATHAPWTPGSPPDTLLFTIVSGLEKIARYGTAALAYVRANRPGVDGYGWADNPDFSVFYNAPVVVILSGKGDNPLALEECTRSGQVLTISAHARGLGACWVGSPNLWLSLPEVRADLAIPEPYRPLAVFTLGYPASHVARTGQFEPHIIWAGD